MKFFSVNSPLYRFLNTFWDVLKLNFCWVLFSIPVVTVGASTTAAFSVALRMSEGTEGYIWGPFVEAFKQNWKKGIPMGIINVVLAYAIYLDFQLFNAVDNNPIMFLIMAYFGIILMVTFFMYSYALLARYDNTFVKTIRNSGTLYVKYIGRSVVLTMIVVVEFVLFFWNMTTLFFFAFMGPACIIYTISAVAAYIFKDVKEHSWEE